MRKQYSPVKQGEKKIKPWNRRYKAKIFVRTFISTFLNVG